MNKVFANKASFKDAFIGYLENELNTTLEKSTVYDRYTALASLLNEELNEKQKKTEAFVKKNHLKKTIYFSMEFLMGRLISNNLQNSQYCRVVKETFESLGIDLNEVEHAEMDAGLGNGGLGRLAACFLDSAASMGLPLYGNSLRYQHGFFRQELINHKQVEKPELWLNKPFIWETKRPDEAIDIPFFGFVDYTTLKHPTWVKAVPYDVKVVGDQNDIVTTLRLWGTEPSDLQKIKDEGYMALVHRIDNQLYPDDSTVDGKTLRLQQQYLFSAAGIQSAIREHKALGRDIKELADYYTFQINDTHPTLIIPELMRLLMDNEGLGYDQAWHIVTRCVAFTNHTILSEALEKWDIGIFRRVLPRIYTIIKEMDRRFHDILVTNGRYNKEQIYLMGLVGNHHIRMAHICIYGAFSINGVAELHTEILKHNEMQNFYQLYPKKFNNKTNGITHRRWLIHTNHELIKILDEKIGTAWRKDLTKLEAFDQFKDDPETQQAIYDMKQAKKKALADKIFADRGIYLDPSMIFDIHAKRLHEYKRQAMNILHIIYVYLRLKKDPAFKKNYHPHAFIFGAKSAPSYHMAKAIIELIDTTAEVINNDPETKDLLKVVFVTNYNVTYAEYIMPAADLSEQISTATKEASGTGNMKFMMNGAITIGTLDGANVEIVKEAGIDNEIIFGMSAEEVMAHYHHNGYRPRDIYEADQRLQDIFRFIRHLHTNPGYFDYVMQGLLNHDPFLVLKDFDSYVKAQERSNEAYKDRKGWLSKSIMNIAHSGYFTSDRTIKSYNDDIWHLRPITLK